MTKNSIDLYIESFSKEVQEKLYTLKNAILEIDPNLEQTISYSMPTFKLNKKNLVHFSAYKNHIGFYPTPSAILKFSKELSNFVTSKGAIQFPLDKPIPLGLVKKIVKFRVQEVLNKK